MCVLACLRIAGETNEVVAGPFAVLAHVQARCVVVRAAELHGLTGGGRDDVPSDTFHAEVEDHLLSVGAVEALDQPPGPRVNEQVDRLPVRLMVADVQRPLGLTVAVE